jgi:hypothetical protein
MKSRAGFPAIALLASLAWLPGVAQADAAPRLSLFASVDANTAFGEALSR